MDLKVLCSKVILGISLLKAEHSLTFNQIRAISKTFHKSTDEVRVMYEIKLWAKWSHSIALESLLKTNKQLKAMCIFQMKDQNLSMETSNLFTQITITF